MEKVNKGRESKPHALSTLGFDSIHLNQKRSFTSRSRFLNVKILMPAH